MSARMVATGIITMIVAVLFSGQYLYPQPPTHDVLTNLLSQESSRHSLLTYTQHYIDNADERVQYTGTIFLQIESFRVDGCILTVNVVVQDRYVGSAEHKVRLGTKVIHDDLGRKADTYHYAYLLNLKFVDEAHIGATAARPSQLPDSTASICEEEKFCDLQWLTVAAKKPLILETRVLNGVLDFNEGVNQIMIPMTSQQTAQQTAKSIQNLAIACR